VTASSTSTQRRTLASVDLSFRFPKPVGAAKYIRFTASRPKIDNPFGFSVDILRFLQTYSNALTFLATLVLVALTGVYAYLTLRIVRATASQAISALNPVIGIKVLRIDVTPVFGPKRRNMMVSIELLNVGNAPAIQVMVDAEIELRYSAVGDERSIPARFEPYSVPYIRPDDVISGNEINRVLETR
jgi:hypothetical protein